MIIQCKSCTRKYIVVDNSIPKDGRKVQCGYCSVTWHQMPFSKPSTSINRNKFSQKKFKTEKDLPIESIKASDGKNYRFLGKQWAEVLPSGKTGLFAKKIISKELNKITGRVEKRKKIREVNPSSEHLSDEISLPDKYVSKKNLGFFGYTFLVIIIGIFLIGAFKFYKEYVLNYYPDLEYLYIILDQQLEYIAETFRNLVVIINDLINSY